MSRKSFTFYRKGTPVSYLWNDIISWDISTEDSTTYLIIEAQGCKEKIGISWLDKNSIQIDEFIQQFKEGLVSD